MYGTRFPEKERGCWELLDRCVAGPRRWQVRERKGRAGKGVGAGGAAGVRGWAGAGERKRRKAACGLRRERKTRANGIPRGERFTARSSGGRHAGKRKERREKGADVWDPFARERERVLAAGTWNREEGRFRESEGEEGGGTWNPHRLRGPQPRCARTLV